MRIQGESQQPQNLDGQNTKAGVDKKRKVSFKYPIDALIIDQFNILTKPHIFNRTSLGILHNSQNIQQKQSNQQVQNMNNSGGISKAAIESKALKQSLFRINNTQINVKPNNRNDSNNRTSPIQHPTKQQLKNRSYRNSSVIQTSAQMGEFMSKRRMLSQSELQSPKSSSRDLQKSQTPIIIDSQPSSPVFNQNLRMNFHGRKASDIRSQVSLGTSANLTSAMLPELIQNICNSKKDFTHFSGIVQYPHSIINKTFGVNMGFTNGFHKIMYADDRLNSQDLKFQRQIRQIRIMQEKEKKRQEYLETQRNKRFLENEQRAQNTFGKNQGKKKSKQKNTGILEENQNAYFDAQSTLVPKKLGSYFYIKISKRIYDSIKMQRLHQNFEFFKKMKTKIEIEAAITVQKFWKNHKEQMKPTVKQEINQNAESGQQKIKNKNGKDKQSTKNAHLAQQQLKPQNDKKQGNNSQGQVTNAKKVSQAIQNYKNQIVNTSQDDGKAGANHNRDVRKGSQTKQGFYQGPNEISRQTSNNRTMKQINLPFKEDQTSNTIAGNKTKKNFNPSQFQNLEQIKLSDSQDLDSDHSKINVNFDQNGQNSTKHYDQLSKQSSNFNLVINHDQSIDQFLSSDQTKRKSNAGVPALDSENLKLLRIQEESISPSQSVNTKRSQFVVKDTSRSRSYAVESNRETVSDLMMNEDSNDYPIEPNSPFKNITTSQNPLHQKLQKSIQQKIINELQKLQRQKQNTNNNNQNYLGDQKNSQIQNNMRKSFLSKVHKTPMVTSDRRVFQQNSLLQQLGSGLAAGVKRLPEPKHSFVGIHGITQLGQLIQPGTNVTQNNSARNNQDSGRRLVHQIPSKISLNRAAQSSKYEKSEEYSIRLQPVSSSKLSPQKNNTKVTMLKLGKLDDVSNSKQSSNQNSTQKKVKQNKGSKAKEETSNSEDEDQENQDEEYDNSDEEEENEQEEEAEEEEEEEYEQEDYTNSARNKTNYTQNTQR
ncbi:UNKNOWN [Stylonychia lemnae]|uniref:Uncharacterized protein n=1 Tax=Stylonychia lemnae TaxID=5949 RepID=A0A078B5M4_STYLE|nr:UNKNOWN [Stylonychia lemnae]|eukprot:CDW89506.1 UNKNOWN [Stylonychia lemnae]